MIFVGGALIKGSCNVQYINVEISEYFCVFWQILTKSYFVHHGFWDIYATKYTPSAFYVHWFERVNIIVKVPIIL